MTRAAALPVALLLLAAVGAMGQRDPGAVFERGMTHYREGELAQARARFLQAADVFDRAAGADDQQQLYQLYSLSWAGLAAQELGDADAAVADYEAALGLAEKLENSDKISRLTASIGMVAFEAGRLERAEEAFLRSRDLNRRFRRWEFLLHDLDN